jgi:wobble nucleotide-excising tRNase
MLHKIVKLESIGKFRNYQASGDVAFGRITLIYSDNGGGKTTLASILRSLTQNNPEFIVKRKSTNQIAVQAAQVIERNPSGDTSHTFNHASGWNVSLPDIEIFDIHFVNKNVYSGFEFNDEHKKELHQFVIGDQGVLIKQQIEQNKNSKTQIRQNIVGFETQIVTAVGRGLRNETVSEFCQITQASAININQRIVEAEAALASANSANLLHTLPLLSNLNLFNSQIDFESLSDDLQSSIQSIQNDSLQTIFESHCSDLASNGIKSSQNWLKAGTEYLIVKKNHDATQTLSCPYCKQTISDTLEIIQAYNIKFNEEFESALTRLQNHISAIRSLNIDLLIQSATNISNHNLAALSSWRTHLPSVNALSYNIISDETNFRTEYLALISAVEEKLENPTRQYHTTAGTTFEVSLQNINDRIAIYNTSVLQINNSIALFRGALTSQAAAQNELDKLKIIKDRFVPLVDGLCNSIASERLLLRGLDNAYAILVQNQELAAAAFFGTYKDRVNYYLATVFKTPFQIEDVVHIRPAGMSLHSKMGYKLTIDGQDISFDHRGMLNVQECLSEGDKSTIALALFLAKIDIDPRAADKIVVIDDPLSSFDRNRRMSTVQIVKDLFSMVKQIVVLTHNEYFLLEISKMFNPGDKKIFQLVEDLTARASKIQPLNIDLLLENEYFKHIRELEAFLTNPDIIQKEIVLGRLRNVLESHLRFKFYRQFQPIHNSRQTLGTLIDYIVAQNITLRNEPNRQNVISKLNLINGISCRPHHGEVTPSDPSHIAILNSMSVTELGGFINDTFNLIDNDL